MAYTPARPDRRRLIVAQLPGRRGEPLVQGPGALLRERPVQLLTGCAAAEALAASVPIRVRKLMLAAMIAATT